MEFFDHPASKEPVMIAGSCLRFAFLLPAHLSAGPAGSTAAVVDHKRQGEQLCENLLNDDHTRHINAAGCAVELAVERERSWLIKLDRGGTRSGRDHARVE